MCDIHMHLIPGVDDGALDLDMAGLLLLRAYEQNIRTIFATPHSYAFRMSRDNVLEKYQTLQRLVEKELPTLSLRLGCEVLCEPESMSTTLTLLKNGQFPTMNQTQYVLTEFQTWFDSGSIISCAQMLIDSGYIPIIAHIERYRKLRGDIETLEKLRAMGCLFQLNVYSVYEEQNTEIKGFANELLRSRSIDFLGSDAHSIYHRPPNVKSGLQYLYECHEKSYIDHIAWGNAEHLLAC